MTQEIVWGCTVGGFILALLTFWINLSSRITTAEVKALAAEKLSETLGRRLSDVVDQYVENRVSLEVKIAAVKTLAEANTTQISQAENRLARALEELNKRMDYFNERIDQLISRPALPR